MAAGQAPPLICARAANLHRAIAARDTTARIVASSQNHVRAAYAGPSFERARRVDMAPQLSPDLDHATSVRLEQPDRSTSMDVEADSGGVTRPDCFSGAHHHQSSISTREAERRLVRARPESGPPFSNRVIRAPPVRL